MKLTLLVPGLLGPTGDSTVDDWLRTRPQALERLLSRSRVHDVPVTDLQSGLAALFGLPDEPLPVAALSYLADTGIHESGYVLRADPVHLRPDQATLRLFEGHTFSLLQSEADALVSACNELYADRGWQLVAAVPGRWYLLPGKAPELVTHGPQQVAGQDINRLLPAGAEAGEWHAVLNEIQMLFHSHPVNQDREARGETLINSVWFWGGGRLPGSAQCALQRVWTDVPEARGLARLAAVEHRDVPGDVGKLLETRGRDETAVIFDEVAWTLAYTDISGWQEAVRRLEQYWFAPLLDAIANGRVSELQVLPGNGRAYTVTRKSLRAFWKPLRRLAAIRQ